MGVKKKKRKERLEGARQVSFISFTNTSAHQLTPTPVAVTRPSPSVLGVIAISLSLQAKRHAEGTEMHRRPKQYGELADKACTRPEQFRNPAIWAAQGAMLGGRANRRKQLKRNIKEQQIVQEQEQEQQQQQQKQEQEQEPDQTLGLVRASSVG